MRTVTTALQTILRNLSHYFLTLAVLAFVVLLFAAPTQVQLQKALDAPLDAQIDRAQIDRAAETARHRAAALTQPARYLAASSVGLGEAKGVSSAVTITVNTLDGGNDGTCGTDGSDPVQDCSLLEAVDQANSELDYDVIGFAVDGVIPIAAEVTITSPVVLDGTTAPGGAHAVRIDASGAGGNAIIINGTGTVNSEVRGLVIGQAQSYGIQIRSGATRIAVLGNYIGTDPDGQNLGNGLHGVNILFGASDNVIGGAAPGAGNTIGFNEFGGVLIQTEGTTGNAVLGNYIGTDPDGQNLGNGRRGVLVASGASGNFIGGAAPGEGNIIGFNERDGILIQSEGTTGNVVLGNYIGTNANSQNLGNGGAGVSLFFEASDNIIGGAAPGEGNTIGFNEFSGVEIRNEETTGNAVLGNYIGTNANGQNLGNGGAGVVVRSDASGNAIGGAAAGEGNTIGFNADDGVILRSGATANTVLGNYIGTDPNGQNLGNGGFGVNLFFEASDNVIGGAAPGAGNTIGFNERDGILIQTEGTTGNAVLGNYIGTNANGQNLGNGRRGVFVASGASGNAIGGAAPGEGNTIGFNVSQGVGLVSAGTTDNAVLGNALFENGGLGIDLQGDGITLNDADDGDGENSPNKLQNYPEFITSDYDATANQVAVTYIVLSDPTLATGGASTYPLRIEFFRADGDGEEGAAFLGTDTYAATDYDGCVASGGVAPCPKDFVFTPAASVTAADVMVATATDATGNTSEFSESGQPLPVELTAFTATLDEGSVRLAWQTATETDNTGFEIERSIGQIGLWTQIGFVDGAGTTSAARSYAFTDAAVPFEAEALTYRLRQVDLDGAFEYSPEVEIAIAAPEAFALEPAFPNPARGPATLRFALPDAGPVRLAVYDMLGREVAVLVEGTLATGRHTARFDGARLPSGVYLVRMTTTTGFTETQRLTLVR